ncbi:hypothetical protein GE061_019696 [Apolygus lucorum]|uniref:Acetyl-CoA acetyltransferase, cytosolic n=1 Tax=Apolygus lucorum TaxID=248454 RepID=A0A6A4JXU7_APOLU|nr:hypothetical protein GE061_019696 [Apolygus lucorum]
MDNVVIVGAARTPIGNFCGSLSSMRASELGSVVIKESLRRANVTPKDVSEVIMGQTLQAGEGQCPARQASLNAGIPIKAPAYSINMLCGSGLKSVVLGYHNILVGDSKIVVCGGQESMTRAPHCIHLRDPVRMGDATMVDTLLNDGLNDAFNCGHMGVTAENIAKQQQISREEQDIYALESQRRAELAQKSGFFKEEIVPVEVKQKNKVTTLEADEFPKHGTTLEFLTTLKPCFVKESGTVTSGNASGVNDGAAAVVLTSEREAAARGLKPLARIVGTSQTGIEPSVMGLGPITAVEKLLKKVGWEKDEVDLYELNEAFAAQSIAVLNGLGVNPEKVNVNGGAISLGHPIGASGARVLVTLIYALKRTGGRKGVASLCIGGGMGIALAIEML